ncbi:unnamed protein product [Echinostoma caproni]|uniref:Uncharacterized protein n=1 Tax=Echinostoma caproni TaxID=27848 RepID=A0A183B7S1_9TREM|nr:unnamed protein product [Echinostoma caproni]
MNSTRPESLKFELIITMHESDPYTQPKKVLINRKAVSDERRLDELFGDLEIRDRTPSQLLRHTRQLLGSRVLDDAILRQLWLKHLPPRIREDLSVLSNSLLDEMAQAADKMFEANCGDPEFRDRNPFTTRYSFMPSNHRSGSSINGTPGEHDIRVSTYDTSVQTAM